MNASQFDAAERPYRNQIAAINALSSDDVVVIATVGNDEIAVWASGSATMKSRCGRVVLQRSVCARGGATDGCHGDTRVIQELGFPVFLQGARPVNISGRSTGVSHGWLVEVDDLRVEPGDIVFAAIDGIAVIP